LPVTLVDPGEWPLQSAIVRPLQSNDFVPVRTASETPPPLTILRV
jgi:hypothetical protein